MKKTMVFIMTILVSALVSFANDEKFFNSLQNCSLYSNSGSSVVDGNKVNYTNKISGWQNDKCVYTETVDYSGLKTCVTCKFSKSHLDELTRVMKAYSTLQDFSGETPDTSSLDSVKDNPIVKVWNKYLQDSSICSMEMLK